MTHRDPGGVPSGRLEAFSDGVFAIAITLLVLELDVPSDADGLLGELARNWPSYLGYLVSFAFIGSVWVAHSLLTKFLREADQVLVGLNLLLLLLVTLLPFTTELMATHLEDNGEHVAVVVFGLNLLLASAMVSLMLNHVIRSSNLAEGVDETALEVFARQRRISLIVQGIATALGLIVPGVAVVAYLVISLLLLIGPITQALRLRHRVRRA